MSLTKSCIFVAALLVCVRSEGKHYKEGEKVELSSTLRDTLVILSFWTFS